MLAQTLQPWKCHRNASTLVKRKPSRMLLSPNVKQGPATPAASHRPPQRNSRNSPFGGMNITKIPRDLQGAGERRSAAEQRRASRHRQTGKPEKEKKEPMKALKMQRRLANVSYQQRTRIKQALAARDNFGEFDLLPVVKESIVPQALGGLVNASPTPIQRLTIPALLENEEGRRRKTREKELHGKRAMRQFLLAAETGSGKTLAYVLPIIDAIKRAEIAEAEEERIREERAQEMEKQKRSKQMFQLDGPTVDEPHPTTGRPRAIILVPTSELVAQVGALVKSMSHTVKYRSALISAAFSSTVIRNRLFSPNGIDIVVSTPHLLSSITEADPNILSRVTHLVIDEADSLLDRSFSPITSTIIDRATPSLQQLIFCSATIPRSLDSHLHKRYPDIRRLVTPNLHAIPRRVQLSVVDIDKLPFQGNRDLACAQTIWDIGKEATEKGEELEKKIVVFVNEREKSTGLAEFLRSKGIDATALSRDSDARKQEEILGAFTGTPLAVPSHKLRAQSQKSETATSPAEAAMLGTRQQPRPASRRELKNVKVLVMTDLGSRGVDTVMIRHVILYDVPHTSIDFIHRLGRVGRMGRRGRGVVLVGKNDRKDIVREVREGMFKGQALI